MDNILPSKSKTPLQLRLFHTLLGLAVFFSLITIPAECQTISLFGMPISSEMLWWPVVYFLLHVINSVYGFGYLRHSVYLVILFRLVYLLFLKLAISLPSASFWTLQTPYTHVLGRDLLYMIQSSFMIWFCALVVIKGAYFFHRKSSNIVFLSALMLFTALNNLLLNMSHNTQPQFGVSWGLKKRG